MGYSFFCLCSRLTFNMLYLNPLLCLTEQVTGNTEPTLMQTALSKWLERDLLIIELHLGVCFELINQSTCIVWGH